MAKPAIVVVDDDPSVLRAVARDLRRKYSNEYRVVRANSAHEAIEAVQELFRRDQVVALFLSDQRMPEMDGIAFLQEARLLFPEAKRVLLTAYADTNAAIDAINRVAADYYLLKPWDPPEEKLYPVLDDLLDDWQANYIPPFEGIRLIDHRWSPVAHELKDFLARNHVPYRFIDVEVDSQAPEALQRLGKTEADIPLLVLSDGTIMENPTTSSVAEAVGLQQQAQKAFYDLAIVGGGPAGLAAAVYGASEGLNTVLIEREAPGGQAGTSSRIENYLGFPKGLSGGDLARRSVTQARRFGVEILTPQTAVDLRTNGQYHTLVMEDGSEITTHAVILAMGLSYRRLDVPGAEALTGAGVYYGASVTEAFSCQDQEVFVVGAGNSAGQGALYLAGYASHVTVLVRGDSLEDKMSQYLVERIYDHPNINVKLNTTITAVHGESHVQGVMLATEGEDEQKVEAAAVFIFIGAKPQTEWLPETVARDKYGYVKVGLQLDLAKWSLKRNPFWFETSVPGVFAVGDVQSQSVKRVASAVGAGSIAVRFVHQHLSDL